MSTGESELMTFTEWWVTFRRCYFRERGLARCSWRAQWQGLFHVRAVPARSPASLLRPLLFSLFWHGERWPHFTSGIDVTKPETGVSRLCFGIPEPIATA